MLSREGTDGGKTVVSMRLLLPVRRMLAYGYHIDVDPDRAVKTATAALANQADLLRGFRPTPQRDVPGLDPDVYGLERRVLDPPGELSNVSGSYGLASYLRVAISPDTEQQILPANGFVGSYVKQSDGPGALGYQLVVYQFGSQPEADVAYRAFKAIEEGEFDNRTAFSVPELPTTPCYYFPDQFSADQLYQRCDVRVLGYLASVDVLGITDPADTGRIRMLPRAQKTALYG